MLIPVCGFYSQPSGCRYVEASDEQTSLPRAPVRNRCQPVEVSFTQLETDHLPARETREQEINAHKAKAKVLYLQH